MRPRTHHRGGHPIRDVVADDEFVEHPGNAGRPRTIEPRPIASMHRPSGWSRSYVLASLRALHLDQHLRPGAPRIKRALTHAARTGNAGSSAISTRALIVRSDRVGRKPQSSEACGQITPRERAAPIAKSGLDTTLHWAGIRTSAEQAARVASTSLHPGARSSAGRGVAGADRLVGTLELS